MATMPRDIWQYAIPQYRSLVDLYSENWKQDSIFNQQLVTRSADELLDLYHTVDDWNLRDIILDLLPIDEIEALIEEDGSLDRIDHRLLQEFPILYWAKYRSYPKEEISPYVVDILDALYPEDKIHLHDLSDLSDLWVKLYPDLIDEYTIIQDAMDKILNPEDAEVARDILDTAIDDYLDRRHRF